VKPRRAWDWLIDVVCGFTAYVGARWIWSERDPFTALHWELATFAAIFLLLKVLIRGRALARRGRAGV
jgi:hypothetical protein